MAFMGIFLMFVLGFIAVVGTILLVLLGCMFFNLLLALISYFAYKKSITAYKNGTRKNKPFKLYWVFVGIAVAFFLPITLTGRYVTYNFTYNEISSYIENSNSLEYNVMNNNYAQAKKLLKKGIDPDTKEQLKDDTLLYRLAAKGFVDNWGDPKSDDDTEDEIKMMQLLIDYGADLEYVHEGDGPDDSWHHYEDEYSYYRSCDSCGRTPFLAAIAGGRYEAVKLLVENGADVTVKDYSGYNGVLTAADTLNDHYDGDVILEYIMENGCRPDAINNFGQDVSFLLFRQNWDNDKMKEVLGPYYNY